MKRLLVFAALAATLLLLAWLMRAEDPVVAPTPETVIPTASVETPKTPPPLATEEQLTAEAPRESVPAETAREEATPVDAPVSRPARRKFDPDAVGAIYLFVQDPSGAAVVDAKIRMTGLYSERNPRITNDWIGEPSSGVTGADGSLRLRYPLWIDPDRRTSQVAFRIEHPDFMAFEAQGFPVDPAPRVIVLQRGAFVIVSGWIDTAADVVRDVTPHLTWGAVVAEDSWTPIKDGRLACANIPPGRHGLYLSYSSTQHGPCFSEVAFFDLAMGEQKELHLRLLPGRGFKGKLDEAVPRPVIDGAVMVNLAVGSSESSGATMSREFTAEVKPDGSFEFESIPPGAGQIIGICSGWASARVESDQPQSSPRLETLSKEEREKKIALMRDLAMVPQSVNPAVLEGPFELQMERTATVQATIDDAKGRPIADAELSLSPNVHWSTGHSSAFMHRTYSGQSDAGGQVTLSNLPRGVVFADVQHERFVLPAKSGADRRIQIELAAGESREVRIVLEPRQDE